MTVSKALRFKLTTIWAPLLTSLLLAVLSIAPAFAEPEGWTCGTLRSPGQFGPYDYRTDREQPLHLVEGAHFLPEIESLIRGKTATTAGPDIDYTLRAFPNHHRALIAMTRLSEKEQKAKPDGAHYSIDCYFQRAVLFQPGDTTVRMLYAIYLNKNNRRPPPLRTEVRSQRPRTTA